MYEFKIVTDDIEEIKRHAKCNDAFHALHKIVCADNIKYSDIINILENANIDLEELWS